MPLDLLIFNLKCMDTQLLDLDQTLIESFKKALTDAAPAGKQKEQVVQDFMEANTELIPTHNILHNGLQFNAVLSKFKLSTALTTDYIYVSKSSGQSQVTLVELEQPDKPLFTSNLDTAIQSAAFTAAIAQVTSWRTFIEDHRKQVIEQLEPLFRPLVSNPVTFQYQLIIGRSKDKNASGDRKRAFIDMRNNTGIEILTYDNVISRYEQGPRQKKNVLRFSKNRLVFKSINANLRSILAYLGPDVLSLSPEHIEALTNDGYEMEKWQNGELLNVNFKYAASSEKAPDWVSAVSATIEHRRSARSKEFDDID